ncbi:GntR family transcriptional regulator [Parasphingorhabdus pacifica]
MTRPQFTALTRPSASEQVYRVLREKIEDGSLPPGEQLADAELAGELGVSRTPVREALRRLVDQGVVEMVPGRHTRVAPVDENDASRVLPLLSVLHEFALRSAFARMTSGDLVEMGACNERMREALVRDDAVAAQNADGAFHAVIMRRADNPYLSTAVDVIALHARRLESLYFREHDPGMESCDQHERIIEAIRESQEERACELIRANMRRGPGHR